MQGYVGIKPRRRRQTGLEMKSKDGLIHHRTKFRSHTLRDHTLPVLHLHPGTSKLQTLSTRPSYSGYDMRSRLRIGTFAEAVEFKGDPTQRGFKVVKVNERVVGEEKSTTITFFSSPSRVGILRILTAKRRFAHTGLCESSSPPLQIICNGNSFQLLTFIRRYFHLK